MGILEGRTAVITGAGNGPGRWTTGEAWSSDGPWTVDAVAALFEPVAAA